MSKLSGAAALTFLLFANLFAAPSGKRIDLAALVSKGDAEAALGESVKGPQPRNGEGTDGYYARCNYYSVNPGKSLVLRVHQSSAGKIEAKNQFEMLSAGTGKIETVSGLGERAGYFNGSGESGESARVLMLYVTKGNAFITVGLGGLSDETMALEKAKGIARKILAAL
jgi:hypothetical protein